MSATCHFIERATWEPKQITLALRDISGLEHTGIIYIYIYIVFSIVPY